MFWTEFRLNSGNVGRIERANLDGTKRHIVLNDVGRASGLTLDHVTDRFYWTDSAAPAIESYNLQTKRRESLVIENIAYPYSITLYRDYIYWTDWNTGNFERANKTTGADRSKVHNPMESVTSMLVFHASRQPGSNSCAANNGDCSHFCIALPGIDSQFSATHKCSCPTHYEISLDNKTCICK